MESKNILWIIIGITFFALILAFASSDFSGFSTTGKATQSSTDGTTIINSYNTYNYYNSGSQSKYKTSSSNYPNYINRAERTTVKGLLGNDIDRYIVYIKNKNKGQYFTVRFIFEDYFGETATQSVTKYVNTNQEVKFTYQDIHHDRYKHNDWDYEIIAN